MSLCCWGRLGIRRIGGVRCGGCGSETNPKDERDLMEKVVASTKQFVYQKQQEERC